MAVDWEFSSSLSGVIYSSVFIVKQLHLIWVDWVDWSIGDSPRSLYLNLRYRIVAVSPDSRSLFSGHIIWSLALSLSLSLSRWYWSISSISKSCTSHHSTFDLDSAISTLLSGSRSLSLSLSRPYTLALARFRSLARSRTLSLSYSLALLLLDLTLGSYSWNLLLFSWPS